MNIQSETIEKLIEALAKAQGEIEVAVYDSNNPHFKSGYASYEAIRKVCKKPLADNGLAITHLLTIIDNKRVMITQLSHASGQWIRSYLYLPQEKETPQGIGSSITYAKRYSISSLLALSSDKDDDANEAEKPYEDDKKATLEREKDAIEKQLNEPLEHEKKEFFAKEINRLNAKDDYKSVFGDRKPESWLKRDLRQLSNIVAKAKKIAGEV